MTKKTKELKNEGTKEQKNEKPEAAPEAGSKAVETKKSEAPKTPVEDLERSQKIEDPERNRGEEVKLTGDAKKIAEMVEKMSVLELNTLVKALEKKFGVTAAAPLAVAANGGANGDAAEPAEEKSEYDVVLADMGANKIQVIKAVREVNQNLGLKEAKDLVESAPKPILEGAKKEDAEAAKAKLEAAGARVELK